MSVFSTRVWKKDSGRNQGRKLLRDHQLDEARKRGIVELRAVIKQGCGPREMGI